MGFLVEHSGLCTWGCDGWALVVFLVLENQLTPRGLTSRDGGNWVVHWIYTIQGHCRITICSAQVPLESIRAEVQQRCHIVIFEHSEQKAGHSNKTESPSMCVEWLYLPRCSKLCSPGEQASVCVGQSRRAIFDLWLMECEPLSEGQQRNTGWVGRCTTVNLNLSHWMLITYCRWWCVVVDADMVPLEWLQWQNII